MIIKAGTTGILLLLAGMTGTSAHAFGFSFSSSSHDREQDGDNYTTNRPWGNLGPAKSAPKYQPPQPAPGSYSQGAYAPGSYYMGAAPGTGWYPAQMPNTAAGNGPPAIEVEVAERNVFEQQNIIYTVRVVSDGNLAVLDDKLPHIDGATLELIDGPVATSRGGTKIVNTYHYRLTPLRAGEIVIPPIGFTGRYAANNPAAVSQGGNFDIKADSPVKLHVQAPDPSVNPWLPLHDLRLQTRLQQDGRLKAGQPVTLVLELTARGAPGNQLPSLGDQLKSSQFRVYRDDTVTTSGISSNGRYVTGTRKETYTLIPMQDGWIRLPDINVAWWDVDTDTARLAGIPPSGTAANGTPVAADAEAGPLLPLYAWIPMGIALGLIVGYLLGTWQRTRPLLGQAGRWLAVSGKRAVQSCQRVGRQYTPTRYVQAARMKLAVLMPGSVRIWMCTRCLEHEENPGNWCMEFRKRVCQHLAIGHSSLTGLAEHIIATNPRAEPERLRELVASLEGAIYGGRALDFPAWKQELQQQLRPSMWRRRRARARRSGGQLPALNPNTDLRTAA